MEKVVFRTETNNTFGVRYKASKIVPPTSLSAEFSLTEKEFLFTISST